MTEEEKPAVPPTTQESKPEFDVLNFFKEREFELDPVTRMLIVQDIIDEWRERRDARRMKSKQPEITLENLSKTLKEAVKEATRETVNEILPKINPIEPKPVEMPDWAKEIQKQQQEILQRLSMEEQAKRDQEIIQKAQEPLKAELEKERVKQEATINELKTMIEMLQKEIQNLKPKEKETSNPLKQVKEILADVTETAEKIGYTKQSPSGAYLTPQGFYQIPIKGEVPASWVIIPSLVESVLNSIEQRATKIFGGIIGGKKETEELIKLPSPPPVEMPTTLPPPPQTEAPTELIMLPEQTPTEPAAPKEAPAQPPKVYTCPNCGATFTRSIDKARHAKKCKPKTEEKPNETEHKA
ncbi:MAG: hypothetical protein QXH03_02690 [Candidatus Bathyarchaeia archaeon]